MNLLPGVISHFDMERDHHDFFMIELDRFDQPMTRMLTEFLKKRYGSDYWFVVDIDGDKRVDAYVLSGVELKGGIAYLHVYSLAVRREYEGKGWAKQLMDHMIEVLLRQQPSASEVRLEVRDNNIRAIEFYKKYGFTQSGIEKNYYQSGVHAILMQLNLNEYV